MSGEESNTNLSPSSIWRPDISTTTTARDGPSATQSTASGGDVTNAISFEKPQGLVYTTQSNPYIDIRFTLASGVKVTSLTWYVDRDGGLQKVNGCEAPDYSDLQSQSREPQVVGCRVADIIEPLRSDLGYPFIFSVDWTADGQTTGRTSSPAFSIVGTDSDIPEAQKKLDKSTYASSKSMPVENDGGSSSSSKLLASTATSSAPTDLFTAPALPTSGSDRNGTSSNISPVGASHGGHKGGLGTGAIVGIAVGVVVAALLAAALCLFFFLRRRRRSKTAVAAREEQTRAEQEKLSSFPKDGSGGVGGGAASASDAAIAPYRDEHNLAGTSSGNARGGLDEHEEHAVPLRQQQHRGLREEEEEERGSRAAEETPHGGVSRHLVEDGMTAAEIRRLEEEEAHLDSEIQRAGGRR